VRTSSSPWIGRIGVEARAKIETVRQSRILGNFAQIGVWGFGGDGGDTGRTPADWIKMDAPSDSPKP
jgi:hypothetical protein